MLEEPQAWTFGFFLNSTLSSRPLPTSSLTLILDSCFQQLLDADPSKISLHIQNGELV